MRASRFTTWDIRAIFPATCSAIWASVLRCSIRNGLEFWGELSFLKAGIVWADAITTVSPTYAREIQTPEYGHGLDGVLRDRAAKITGILNGVDYAEWNPDSRSSSRHHIRPQDLSGKRLAKRALLEEVGLPLDMRRGR